MTDNESREKIAKFKEVMNELKSKGYKITGAKERNPDRCYFTKGNKEIGYIDSETIEVIFLT